MPFKDIKKQKEHNKKYYLANKESILEKTRIKYRTIRENESEEERVLRLNRRRAIGKKYYYKNKTKIQEDRRKTYKKVKLRYQYNLSVEQYDELLKKQNFTCRICNKKDNTKITSTNFPLVIDHCHKTNKIRGLLCSQCNILLGMAKDETSILESAIKYLEEQDE